MDTKTRHPEELEASLQRLFHRNIHLIKLDLEPMRVLLDLLGNPQNSYICVHVAGTNGKGSVCAMVSSILQHQGYRTGLYTSPHLVRFNERIQINREPVSDEELIAFIDEVEMAAAKLPSLGHRDVTFFEFTTAIAFLYFQRRQVEVAVIETGMGGRLDATNIMIPAVSIITSIGLEHTAYLGDTIEKIAAEKAGIIKPGRPVILGSLSEDARDVISARAHEINAPLYVAEDQVNVTARSVGWEGQSLQITSEQVSYGTVKLPLPGRHQAANAAVAVAVAECLNNVVGVVVSDEAVKKGISETSWLARGQLLSDNPPILLDGAHNPEAAAALAEWTKKAAGKKPLGLIAGFLSDKDPAAFMRSFSGRARRVWIVPIHSDRAMSVEDIAHRLNFIPHVDTAPDFNQAITAARAWAEAEDGIIIITGSLYLAGEVLAVRY
jgi:dihydrofolate synthase / folylpolyglutamate synthase